MAITIMCSKDHPDAVWSEYWSNQGERKHDIYLRTFAVNRVLKIWERNGYHDSDFMALYWDDDKGEPTSIEYASTRGWSYPNGAAVDADKETLARYAEYQRRHKVRLAWSDRRADMELAHSLGLPTYHHVRKIRNATPREYVREAFKLLDSMARGSLRSKFRKSLAQQIIAWAKDPEPKYARPLSQRQWSYLRPFRPY